MNTDRHVRQWPQHRITGGRRPLRGRCWLPSDSPTWKWAGPHGVILSCHFSCASTCGVPLLVDYDCGLRHGGVGGFRAATTEATNSGSRQRREDLELMSAGQARSQPQNLYTCRLSRSGWDVPVLQSPASLKYVPTVPGTSWLGPSWTRTKNVCVCVTLGLPVGSGFMAVTSLYL